MSADPQRPIVGPGVDPLLVAFVGGDVGEWQVDAMTPVAGPSLQPARRVCVIEGAAARANHDTASWTLVGVTSHDRYLTVAEQTGLAAAQEPLGRAASTRAALIPISKSESWWALPAGERRRIFEESSHHVSIGLEYLPRIARRLHYGRELGAEFDFLTWFEYAPEHVDAFEQLLARLRATEEWSFVDREVDLRLSR